MSRSISSAQGYVKRASGADEWMTTPAGESVSDVEQAVECLKERIKQANKDSLAVDADMQRSVINRLRLLPTKKASFVEPMECLSVSRLPEGSQWLWEIKLDGYRAVAVKSDNGITLFSRRKKSA